MLPFELSGRWQYRWRSLLVLDGVTFYVTLRRLLRGPRLPGWSWGFETATYFAKWQTAIGYKMNDPIKSREYEDALVFRSPALSKVEMEAVTAPVKGHWVQPKGQSPDVTVLYLHGGGYAYYSRSHSGMIALATLAAQSRTFALDYRLVPEHPYPAQLEDARAAYQWLLDSGIPPQRLVVMGDSAGGNLTLALLLSLRQANLPLPALAVCIGPWVDLENSGESMTRNEPFDWIEKRMADQWSQWLCRDADPRDPLVSPLHADLRGLPPIYMQMGDSEILYDMIHTFAEKARDQGANVTLDTWKNMNHDFWAFGDTTPASQEALEKIAQVITKTIR